MAKISATINICNEAYLLRDCLKSLSGFADEIVVCDMMSSDGGQDIAREFGCIVFSHPRMPYGEYTIVPRIQRATGDWILLFDPDMRLPEKTAERLREIVKNNEADVVQFFLRNKVFGKYIFHGHGSAGYYTKFFKKEVFLKNGIPDIRIHRMVNDTLRKATDRWIKLDREYFLEHLAYDNVFRCFQRHLQYAKIEADERYTRGERFCFKNMLLEVVRKILVDFIYRSAWRDGMPAIIYSLISELMIFQTHLFLWEYDQRKK